MITEKEIQAAQLSPTRKDFYQIWNELLETAKNISERWDPTSTNEADPGIVLLKVLTAIADKMNYNIDKNILEAFMPSATQEESMRKLCEMLGYNIKYYESATTNVIITYTGDKDSLLDNNDTVQFTIPAGSTITTVDNEVVFTTTKSATFTLSKNTDTNEVITTAIPIPCIQGKRLQCNTINDNNVVTLDMLDDNLRYYLPEAAIAENGIEVYNYVNNGTTPTSWEKKDNLNTVIAGMPVFKFGFDSRLRIPYLQFPEDVSSLIQDGLLIYYYRTDGSAGNVSARQLTVLSDANFEPSDSASEKIVENIETTDFVVTNPIAATNGHNIETIDQAYNSYKKTIGTFDTLVTCRDYMNKIYQLVDETTGNPLVSNIIASDIRDDINRAYTLCEFSEYGIKYVNKAIKDTVSGSDKINHFDLVLYPFKTIYGINDKTEYMASFSLDPSIIPILQSDSYIEDFSKYKTLSHNIVGPNTNVGSLEIACIKNYLKLNAKITTTTKVNSIEESAILLNIQKAIYAAFNARQIDFGEEIPYESILAVIEQADPRVKNVILDEPVLVTHIMTADNVEYYIGGSFTDNEKNYKILYNKLILRNILAGRIKMFDYDLDFKHEFTDAQYKWIGEGEVENSYAITYPEAPVSEEDPTQHITQLVSSCELPVEDISEDEPLTLTEGEVIQFAAPNIRTTLTYPAYVNYSLYLSDSAATNDPYIPATFMTLKEYFSKTEQEGGAPSPLKNITTGMFEEVSQYNKDKLQYTINSDENNATKLSAAPEAGTRIYEIKINDEDTFNDWFDWILKQTGRHNKKLAGLYHQLPADRSRVIGEMVDYRYYKYQRCDYARPYAEDMLSVYFVQETFENDDSTNADIKKRHTADGFGHNGSIKGIPINSDYELQDGDYLLINYTKAASDENSTDTVINLKYTKGAIIKPNFQIKDSVAENKNGKSYAKSSGFDFTKYNNYPDGLMSLGPNEQIEIRDIAKVELKGPSNIYWMLQPGSETETAKGVFPFDAHDEYTLKENEYFYYTDSNKLDMAYYGFGTKITRSSSSIVLSKSTAESETLAEDILKYGLTAIPWVSYTFSDNNRLTLTEYQYINLTAGDKLIHISNNINQEMSSIESITPDPQDVVAANYIIGGEENKLPAINVTDCGWKVSSKLEFNMGPDKAQTLYNIYDSIEVKGYPVDSEGDRDNPKTIITLKPETDTSSNVVKPLIIKSNYAVQQSTAIADVRVTEYDDDGKTVKSTPDNFKLLVADKQDVTYKHNTESRAINLNNLNNYWTMFSLNELNKETENERTIKLKTSIPSDKYGLIMFYYLGAQEGLTIDISGEDIELYNRTDIVPVTENNISVIKISYAGIYVIKIPDTCQELSIAPSAVVTGEDKLIFGQLDIINGINSHLDYKKVNEGSEESEESQLLADITNFDADGYAAKNFYYNMPIDNSIAIDLNEALDEKLTDPKFLYDYNNINNKFVISEIDAESLKTGITITRSSKL